MATTPRQLAREQTMREIVRIGRQQLASVSPADLSLRAVARELGVVSSAIYRYVKNRDELLTLLIVDAYDELGDAVDDAMAQAARRPRARLLAASQAARAWALRESSRYALLYGTPVPGYAAPAERTVEPGTRVAVALLGVLDDAHRAGQLEDRGGRLPRSVRQDLDAIGRELDVELPAPTLARAFALWTGVFGLISFDVFGQYGPDTFSDRDAFFAHQIDLLADLAGLTR